MNLITNLYDLATTQAHIVVMMFGIGLFLAGSTIIALEFRKIK